MIFGKGKNNKEKIPEGMSDVIDQVMTLKREVKELKQQVKQIKEEQVFFVQHMGVVRFNPFSDSGGNQSFSLAVLDGEENGFVITSLYGKDGNRIYGKEIEQGKSKHPLSDEERKAILNATKSK